MTFKPLWILLRLFGYIVAVCFCGFIFIKEYSKRKTQISLHKTSIYQKLLNIWSLMIIIYSILTCIFAAISLIPIYIFCYLGTIFTSTLWAHCKDLLTFYQIARLQYCFLNKQIHSKQYGYPQYLFYIYYIY